MELQLTQEQREKVKNNLLLKYKSNEEQLNSVRGCSPLIDGWQTSKYSRKSRKWDILAQEQFTIKEVLFNDFGIEV